MNCDSINEIISFIKTHFPEDATEISDALDILNLAFDGLLTSSNKRITELNEEKEYDRSMKILELSKSITEIQKKIEEYSSLIYLESDLEEDTDELTERQTIPNYSEYTVDSSVPHTLYEDFTNKKVAAFQLSSNRYTATNWKGVLLQTCNLLAKIDADKFSMLINDPDMKGRKISYFSRKHVSAKEKNNLKEKNARIKGTDIYVWTNLSANKIRDLIFTLLNKFHIKTTEYSVFLRADYTALHRESNMEDEDGSIKAGSPEGEKVGYYVRQTLRQLSEGKYYFSNEELTSMMSGKWSKEILDLDFPFIKKYEEDEDISVQIKEGMYHRYWKEIYIFDGMKFLVTNQWYERNRELFRQWVANLQH